MPELPEVETTRRGIAPHIEGRQLEQIHIRDSRLRWPVPTDLNELLGGQQLLDISRRGKYLLLRFPSGHLLCHLGMSGSLRIIDGRTIEAEQIGKHDHIDLVFSGGTILRYTDPRRFGSLLWTDGPVAEHELLVHLGPEPLTDDFDAEYLYQRSRKRTQALKTFVMDSHIVVGVGNIYANEALFRSCLRPTRAAGTLTRSKCERLVTEIKVVLAHAIAQGGTTLRDFVGGDGKPGYFKQELLAYGRGGQPCTVCGKPMKEIKLAQRATVYCTQCQS